MTAYTPSQWSDLFVAAAGASAALTGLVFVAVSINIERILKLAGLPERALLTLTLLMGAVIVSLLSLAPGQSATALGLELLAASLAVGAGVAILTQRSLPEGGSPRSWRIGRIGLSCFGTVPFIVAGASLLAGHGGGLYWALAGMIFALAGAVLNAWVLLVEILR